MTTSSPEAKQPAKWYIDRTDLEAMQGLAHIIENGAVVCQIEYEKAKTVISFHNAATAKLREQIAELEYQQFCDHHPDNTEVSHQQPSATQTLRDKLDAMLVAEVKRHGGIPHLHPEELEFREAIAEFLSNQQPSATTPDVEKIARELESSLSLVYYQVNSKEFDYHPVTAKEDANKLVKKALTQVCEPLVELLKGIRIGAPDIVRKQIDAALTGTEEQK